jgi:hypothetical protein
MTTYGFSAVPIFRQDPPYVLCPAGCRNGMVTLPLADARALVELYQRDLGYLPREYPLNMVEKRCGFCDGAGRVPRELASAQLVETTPEGVRIFLLTDELGYYQTLVAGVTCPCNAREQLYVAHPMDSWRWRTAKGTAAYDGMMRHEREMAARLALAELRAHQERG